MTARQREIQQLLDARGRATAALDQLRDNWPPDQREQKRAAINARLALIRQELNALRYQPPTRRRTQ